MSYNITKILLRHNHSELYSRYWTISKNRIISYDYMGNNINNHMNNKRVYEITDMSSWIFVPRFEMMIGPCWEEGNIWMSGIKPIVYSRTDSILVLGENSISFEKV